MTLINGIDFSGAQRERDTWLVQGSLDGNSLTLEHMDRIRREPLLQHLLGIDATAIVAIDVPFGFPEEFLNHIGIDEHHRSFVDIWPQVAGRTMGQIMVEANHFLAGRKEPRRVVEEIHGVAKSTLHQFGPDMLTMTYVGAQWLTDWQRRDKNIPWHLLPVHPLPEPEEQAVTMMETMPGAFLTSVGLPHDDYKGNTRAHRETREIIINGLESGSRIKLLNLDEWRDDCLNDDNCLDALSAAVCAAAFKSQTLDFRHPNNLEEAAARREGWLYAPVRAGQ